MSVDFPLSIRPHTAIVAFDFICLNVGDESAKTVAAEHFHAMRHGFVLARPAGAFRNQSHGYFINDFFNGIRPGINRSGYRHAPEGTVAFAVNCKVKGAQGKFVFQGILPDVQFRPVQQGIDPVMPFFRRGNIDSFKGVEFRICLLYTSPSPRDCS